MEDRGEIMIKKLYNPHAYAQKLESLVQEALACVGHSISHSISFPDYCANMLSFLFAPYVEMPFPLPIYPSFIPDCVGRTEMQYLVTKLISIGLPRKWINEGSTLPEVVFNNHYKSLRSQGFAVRDKGGFPIKINPEKSYLYLTHLQVYYIFYLTTRYLGADTWQAIIASNEAYIMFCNISRGEQLADVTTVLLLARSSKEKNYRCSCLLLFSDLIIPKKNDDPNKCPCCRAKENMQKYGRKI